MRDEAELMSLAKKMLAFVEAGTTDQTDCTMEVPMDRYNSPERWQAEMNTIFKRVPLALALTCELREPHSYKAIDVLGTPVLITRDGNGEVHAMLNVCRHRGASLVDPGCATARRFACPYHGWTYDQHGTLVGVYGEEAFGPFDRNSRGLATLACEERAGFVFVIITPRVEMQLDDWLGDYAAELETMNFADWHLYSQRRLDGAGWKVCYDGYLEGYHFASLHRNTIFTQTMSNLMLGDAYGPHQRVMFAKHSISTLRGTPESEWVPQEHIGPIYTIFPHISIAGGWSDQAMVSQLFPGPTYDRSHTIQNIITRHPVMTDADRTKADGFTNFLYDVVRDEDYKTGIGIQKGLLSGANESFIFGRNELTLQRFHGWVERLMNDA